MECPTKNRSIRVWSAATSLVGLAMFIIVVFVLHLPQPGYEPQHKLMSELALGQHGWAMFFAFLGFTTAVSGILAASAALGGSRGYRFLLGGAAFLFLAACVFPLGTTAFIHISAIAAAFVLSVLAMYLFPTNAGRASVAAPRAISWSLAAGVAASVALGHSVMPLGIGQRFAAACLLVWLWLVGWKLLRL